MKYILLIIFILITLKPLFAQENVDPIKLLVSSRVDTKDENVKSILKLYEDYYKSKPETIKDSPYWNQKEKELYKDFDFSRASIFQGEMNTNTLFTYFFPFVMSVEPIGEKYQIRVLFSSSVTDPKYAGSKVWCIQKLNAIKENGKWVLENLMVEISKKWSSKKVGHINYIYPPDHPFNDKQAELGKRFCSKIIQRFNPDFKSPFNYYVTSNLDDMGLLENFDYYFVGVTPGKAREGMILTAKGNEHFPHEFVHKLLPENPRRGDLIEEGLAQFLGTMENKDEYDGLMNKLATDLKTKPEKINFKSVISQTITFSGYQTKYPAGAGICELVHDLCGDNGLIQLLNSNTETYDGIINTVSSITKLSEPEIESKWLNTLKKYYRPR